MFHARWSVLVVVFLAIPSRFFGQPVAFKGPLDARD